MKLTHALLALSVVAVPGKGHVSLCMCRQDPSALQEGSIGPADRAGGSDA